MTRTLMPKLAVVILLVTTINEGLAQCHSQDSNDQKLEVLNQPLDRSNHEAVECAFALMDDLSRGGDQRVLPVLIRNLDLEQTKPIFFNINRHPTYPYPAIANLAGFGEKAEPLLLDVIARAAPGWSRQIENAIKAVMLSPRRDPTEGIRILLRRADQEQGQAAANMIEAAKYAVSLCGYKEQACEDMIWPRRLRTLSHPAPK